jgi:hypothetical protein
VVIASDTAVSHTTGYPSTTQIFNYIQDAYNHWAVPPEFVCIMSDVDNGFPDYGYTHGSNYASDQPYTMVDGSDYFCDVMVTRMSVPTNNNTARITVRKAVKYDSAPYMGDPNYYLRGLAVGGNTNGGITQRLTVLWARQQLLRHGFAQVDTAICWVPSGYSCSTNPQISASFNAGVSLAWVRGAGGASGWWAPPFDISALNALNYNNKMSILAVLTCGTGEFRDDCLAEEWIRAGLYPDSVKGGPAYYGVSDGSTHCKWNNPIMIGYTWAYLEEGIYNFSMAAFRGKLEDYYTYPRFTGPQTWVEHYFHTYNTFGEPELEIRTAIPQTMTVTYPTTLPVGSTYMTVHVVGSNDSPLANAYVCLQKDGSSPDEVFVGGRTNSSGDITFNFSTPTSGAMNVTATYHNYIPHKGTVTIQSQAVAVNVSSIALDDDNLGNSSGNNDGNANPAETVELSVPLHNFGSSTTATNVSATLVSSDPNLSVTIPTQTYGSIASGATASSGKFAVHLAGNMPHGERYVLSLNITSTEGSWSGAVPIDIKNMSLITQGLSYPGNSNNRLDPGETSQLVVSLENLGGLAGTSINGVITTSDTSIIIVDGSAGFGSIAIGATGDNSLSPFIIQAKARVYPGRNVNFNLELTSSNGSIAQRPFSLVIGNANTYDPIGPDAYGYYIYDNTDGAYLSAPAYNWVDISGIGTHITFPVSTDDDAIVVNLPFQFTYYHQRFNYMLVSINGFVAFDTSRVNGGNQHWTAFDNSQIPEPGAPDGLIAPFWDDLEYTGTDGVFYYYDSVNHRYIVEWKNCTLARAPSHSPETFEMFIYDSNYDVTPTGDCEIVFQYSVVNNTDDDSYNSLQPGLYCTVGMQNLSNNDGLQYTFDNFYHAAAAALQSGRAIKITTVTGLTAPPDIDYNPQSFYVSTAAGQIVRDTLTIFNVSGGLLNFTLNEFTDSRLLLNSDKSSKPAEKADVDPIGYSYDPAAKTGDNSVPIYPPMILNTGGPDTYGYNWVDSDEPGGPTYGWVDITGVGTHVTITNDDNPVGPFPMGMSFPFYGNSYSSIYICPNGIFTFVTGTNSWTNANIPNAADPNNFIAPLWDDLSPENGGAVYYYYDNANSRFIISFTNTPFYSGGGNLNFEVIMYPSGRISYEYASVDGGTRTLNQLTIGIENSTGDDGLQVVQDAAYLHSNMAILFYPPTRWLFSSIHGGNLLAGQNMISVITFDATSLSQGTYTGHLDLDSNDPDEASLDIPITFVVGSQGTPNISFTPSQFRDTLTVGQTSIQNLVIRNSGNANLIVNLSATEFSLVSAKPSQGIGTDEKPADVENTWLFISPAVDTIAPGDSAIEVVNFDARFVLAGDYTGRVRIVANDPDQNLSDLPVAFRVLPLGAPNISFSPASFTNNLSEGQVTTNYLIIRNLGESNLFVNLSAVELSLLKDNSGNSDNSDGANKPADVLNTWLFVGPLADTIVAGDSAIEIVTFDARFIGAGTYNGRIDIASNDPDTPSGHAPVTLDVTPIGPTCDYVTGDINNNGVANGIDVVYGVGYFKGGPTPPVVCSCPPHGNLYVAGDVNGSCVFNGIDITYFVGYLKGGSALTSCSDCPPTIVVGKRAALPKTDR